MRTKILLKKSRPHLFAEQDWEALRKGAFVQRKRSQPEPTGVYSSLVKVNVLGLATVPAAFRVSVIVSVFPSIVYVYAEKLPGSITFGFFEMKARIVRVLPDTS